MGKHETRPAAQPAAGEPKKQEKAKKRRTRTAPLILVGLCTALILLAVFILRDPDGAIVAPPSDPTAQNPDAQPDPGTQVNPLPTDVDEPEPREFKEQFFTFLLAGTNDGYNTDTMMLCSVDVTSGQVNMISIPRDSMVDRDTSIPKINGAYGRDGVEEMCAEVSEVTGVPINYYCVINVSSFVRIIDLIGGVDYNVPMRMYHPDAQSEYTIDLQAGWQTLSGREAAQFCRFRGTAENDFGRMNRQKDFLLAALRQVRDKFALSQIEGFIDVFNESVKTNMSARDMVWFYINVLSSIDLDNDIATYTLPYTHAGKYKKQDYVYLDAAGILELVNATVNPYTTDLTEKDLHIVCLED